MDFLFDAGFWWLYAQELLKLAASGVLLWYRFYQSGYSTTEATKSMIGSIREAAGVAGISRRR